MIDHILIPFIQLEPKLLLHPDRIQQRAHFLIPSESVVACDFYDTNMVLTPHIHRVHVARAWGDRNKGAWAVVEIASINQRQGEWQKPDKVPLTSDIVTVVVGVALFAVLLFAHPYFTGIPLMPG